MSQSLYPMPMTTPHHQPSGPHRESHLTKVLAVVVLVLAAVVVFLAWHMYKNTGGASSSAHNMSYEPRPISQRPDDKLGADEKSTIEVFEKFSRAVVHITSLDTRRDRMTLDVSEIPQGTGSGFIWDINGHVVTNFHVIQHGNRASVTLQDGSTYPARIIGKAPDKDLAVLKIDAPAQKLQPLPIGASTSLKVGQKVLAIGNPFGLDQTLTTGVISGLGREIKSVTQRSIFDVIQTDASINPGNSGGPLLDSAGRLIGVNTAIYSPSGANAGIGFAVPVDTVNAIVPQLLKHGRVTRPGLGINILQDHVSAQHKIEGVAILGVTPGGAADQAGISGAHQTQDGMALGDVIVKLDTVEIKKSSDLYRALDNHKVGDIVDVVVENQGKRRSVKVTLQALP